MLSSALKQQENFKNEIKEVKDAHAKDTAEEKSKLKSAEEVCQKIESDIAELKTSADDFTNEIEAN